MTSNAHNASADAPANYRAQAGHEPNLKPDAVIDHGANAQPLYSVSQLARQLGVTARTIRFYEDKGLVTPSRAGTTRVYTHRDRARLMLILRGKRLGFSLREIKEFLDLYDMDPTQHTQMKQLLIGVRKRIAKLQEQRSALEQSLGELAEIERQAEATLKQRSL